MSTKAYVSYKEFGAVGDGVTNDFAAIRAAHAYANENGIPVKAGEGSFLIGDTGTDSVEIKTSTDWTGATIIIDDRDIAPADASRRTSVIKVMSDYVPVKHEADSELVRAINAAGGIKTTTEKIPYAFGYPVMMVPYDTTHKVYIRYGGNANSGQDQHEVMVIAADGTIDKDTPALLDYNNISYVMEYRIDDAPITLLGGTFITYANQAPNAYTYYSRNISVRRSNVTVKGFEHKILEEGDHGAPYAGFLSASDMNNLYVEDCIFQAHRFYPNEDPSTGGPTCMGTYEIGGGNANNLYYKNCKQSNFYDPNGNPTSSFFDKDGNRVGHGIWGVMGTNYCKNITYENCKLNRFDAHAGVYNATILNTEIISINLIGGGVAKIDGCTVYNRVLLNLRSDYGSFWHGDIVISNTELVSSAPMLISGGWVNHNFGYSTYLPNVTIDNLTVRGEEKNVVLFSDYVSGKNIGNFSGNTVMIDGVEVENKNPMDLPKKITVRNSDGINLTAAPVGCWMSEDIKIDFE